tara:strand:+ start:181 stop:627 length:447 start_codon:yes stop_codon:yes gene_type:complete
MKISSIKDLEKLSNNIKKKILIGDAILLYGEIGVGKTTFARLLINSLENDNKLKNSEVLSPTFNIVFEYKIKGFSIKHYDFYRLKDEKDIKNIGLFENIEKNITLIEWPEILKKKPLNRIDIFFQYKKNMNDRILKIKTYGRLKSHEF